MHYIRFVRPPTVTIRDRGKTVLRLALTIATDLGDAYLCPEAPIPLTLTYWVNDQLQKPSLPLLKWTAGMRVCKLDVPLKVLARGSYVTKIFVSPAEPNLGLMHMQQLLTQKTPMIVPVVATPALPGVEPKLFTNRQVLLGDMQNKRVFLAISEEIQDSIARRVWDSGMVTAALLFELAPHNARPSKFLPLTQELVRADALSVLELGCGVGTLGISMATALVQRHVTPTPAEADVEHAEASTEARSSPETSRHRIVLTDLPDAEEVAQQNIELFNTAMSGLVAPTVAYENLDWFDCKEGVFGPLVSSKQNWDLVIISDCTYNADVIPVLVASLDKLHYIAMQKSGKGPHILLSTKFRHDSETVFWDQMEMAGWEVREKAEFPVANIGAAAEQIEVYLFSKKAGTN
ncbi:hypothetical protein CFIMG_004116RA [Ceratocystis fimbriata CBS 114723]|uniref:Uncharacterized protein n=1 Tax=Ceratocystis fimbriata CBS 114723 TaxID=1035309 RepID=A0A2C5WZM2_9PEZI|nr:hypothetical protein CFIMG_004116RA [Ceratocystis fimbriata CBS 114723]